MFKKIKRFKSEIIVILVISIFFGVTTFSFSCATNNRLAKYEEKLKELYTEVVYIKQNRFITVDRKGNIFLVELNGKYQQILSLQDIEAGLDREFTLSDINKPNDPYKRK